MNLIVAEMINVEIVDKYFQLNNLVLHQIKCEDEKEH